MTCPVCASDRSAVFRGLLLGRHEVDYYLCDNCGLLQTEEPYWLDEAYRNAIADTDTGIVERNRFNCEILTVILDHMFGAAGRFLDIAGGYGLLTRMLRDRGFDCWTSDKYCKNLLAIGFDAPPGFTADAMFAFEVLEHVIDPVTFLGDYFKRHNCRTLVLSTATFSGRPPDKSWWYYSFESGQHISFYQTRTLAYIASKLGCKYFMVNREMHILSVQELPFALRLLLRKKRLGRLAAALITRRRAKLNLAWADHLRAKRLIRDAQQKGHAPSA